MRYVLAVILICAAGMTTASAGTANTHKNAAPKAAVASQNGKHNHSPARNNSLAGTGIHPLVGSGAY